MARILNPGIPVPRAPRPNSARSASFQPARAPLPIVPATSAGVMHKIGLYSFCVYIFSAYANDLSLRVFGGKAYLSWFSGLFLIIAFLGCGTTFRGLQSRVGKAWLGLLVCLLLSAAFSIWRSASFSLLQSYIPKCLFLFFFACAFTLTLRQCRTLILANVACTTAIILSAALFGAAVEGRFAIPGSFLFGGANDLALALVCSLGFTVFLVMQKSVIAQILGAGEFLLTLYFLLKTGSRGGFIALATSLTILLIFSGSRWKLIALMIPGVALVPLLPGSTLNRLVEIAAPTALDAETASNEASESQLERTMLLRKSIVFALTHPLFGVGPGEFSDALYESDVANKTHTHALGTHNTYTQVASECGFPALILYMFILCGSIASNYRIVKRTRKMRGGEKVFTMALCLLGSLAAFAVNTIFHHDAYSQTLPVLSGMSIALAMASRGGDPGWIEAETAAGNV